MADEEQKPKTTEAPEEQETKAPEGVKAETPPPSPDATKAEVEAAGKKAVEIAQMSLREIKQMGKQQLKDMFLIKSASGAGGDYKVDFRGNEKAEKKIGLQDLFDENTSLLLVQKGGESAYAERGKGGFYYEPGTDKRVTIFTGDIITLPMDDRTLAIWRDEANEERSVNIKETRKKKAVAKRRTEKTEEVPMVAKEKSADLKQKLLAYLADMPDYVWTESQKTTLAKALLSSKSDLDVSKEEDADLVAKVFGYLTKNPNLSEGQLTALATYAGMPDSTKEQFVSALKENKFELRLTNPETLAMLEKVLTEFRQAPKELTKEGWSQMMNGSQDNGPIIASN